MRTGSCCFRPPLRCPRHPGPNESRDSTFVAATDGIFGEIIDHIECQHIGGKCVAPRSPALRFRRDGDQFLERGSQPGSAWRICIFLFPLACAAVRDLCLLTRTSALPEPSLDSKLGRKSCRFGEQRIPSRRWHDSVVEIFSTGQPLEVHDSNGLQFNDLVARGGLQICPFSYEEVDCLPDVRCWMLAAALLGFGGACWACLGLLFYRLS